MFAILGFGQVEMLAIAGGAVIVLFALLLVLVRVLGGKKKIDPDAGLDEILAEYPPAPPAGTHRLMFEGQPVRIRLVVVAAAGRSVELKSSMAEGILETVLHGLGSVAQLDKPRIRIWPPQPSLAGFAPTFFRHVQRAEATGRPSKWILAAGPAKAGTKPVLLGLALEAREQSSRGSVPLTMERWPEVLRVQVVG